MRMVRNLSPWRTELGVLISYQNSDHCVVSMINGGFVAKMGGIGQAL
jgi:hypothetical protein